MFRTMANKLIIGLLGLSLSQGSFASSGARYLAEARDIPSNDAKDLYERLKPLSAKFSFLNCPIELIERQWNGLESVMLGVNYLEEFIDKINIDETNVLGIESRCNNHLLAYRKADKKGKVIARALNGAEIKEIENDGKLRQLKNYPIIRKMLEQSINKDTLCFTKRYALKAGYIFSVSAGVSSMKCTTPLGRRFKLRGPSFGAGVGSGITVSVPLSSHQTDKLSYRIRLFERQEKRIWKEGTVAFDAALGAGISREADDVDFRPLTYKDNLKHDYKLTLGAGLITEKYKGLMAKKDMTPLYWFIDEILMNK